MRIAGSYIGKYNVPSISSADGIWSLKNLENFKRSNLWPKINIIGNNLPINTDVKIWLDGTDTNTMWQDSAGNNQTLSDGQSVSKWDDKSGSDNHFVQSVTSSSPKLSTTTHTQNGLSGILFDGSDDFLSGTNGLSSQQELTLFCVWKIINRGIGTDKSVMTIGNRLSNTAVSFVGIPFNFNSTNYGVRAPFFDQSVSPSLFFTSNDKQIFSMRINSSTLKLNINSSSYNLNTPWSSMSFNSGIEVGRSSPFDSLSYANLVMYELILYGNYLSDSDTGTMISYLDTKWGII